MSTPLADTTEVLRGMHVEALPLRVGRTRATARVVEPPPVTACGVTADEEALQQRRQEAARQGHEEGRRAGYETGLRQGLADAGSQVQSAVEKAVAQTRITMEEQQTRLCALVDALQRATVDVLAAAEEEMVALCYETICRVLADTAARPETVRAQLTALAARVPADRRTAMHVHPDDAALLAECTPAAGIAWVADPEVAIGGCVVRHPGGGLDARLETMLEACKTTLLAARAQRARAGAMPAGAGR